MNFKSVTFVRIYLTEGSHLQKEIFNYLKNEAKLPGVSIFRAIGGFGSTGTHSTSLVDLSLDLPLVIEFFDDKEKIEPTLNHLSSLLKPGHIVFWEGQVLLGG